MIVWSNQPYQVYEQLMSNGIFTCDPTKSMNIQTDLNFGGHDFENAYTWMAHQMGLKVGKPPKGVRHPIWVWYKLDYAHRRPDFRLVPDYDDQVCLELEIPESDILLSDFEKWHFVLNDWYLNDAVSEKESYAKDQWFEHLPQVKQQKVKENSWQQIFDVTPRIGEWTQNGAFVQGCCWLLKKEYVRHAWRLKRGQRSQQIF